MGLHFGRIQNEAIEKSKKALFSLLLLLAALAVLAACGSKAVTAADKIKLERKYLSELNYTEAVASFTEAIKLDPDNIQAYMGRAEVNELTTANEDALSDYEEASTALDTVDVEKITATVKVRPCGSS